MAKEKICKKCGKELDPKAVVCTSCGVKIKPPVFKRWWFWVIAAVVVIGIAGSGGDDTSEQMSVSTDTAAVQSETVYNIGDEIQTDKFNIVLKSVETKKSVGSEYFSTEPSAGGIYVALVWEYKNVTDKPIASYSCPSIYMLDTNGTRYDKDISASSYYATQVNIDTKVLSDLNPGITVTDADVFEISEEMYNQGGFSVLIDADKDIKVKIN